MASVIFDSLLTTAGEDLLGNHFLWNLVLPSLPIVFPTENLSLRVTEASIPEQVIGTYEITKRGKKFERVSGVSEQTKEFTITYRVDKYLTVYNAISAWLSYIQKPQDITMASDSGPIGAGGISTFRCPLVVLTCMDTTGRLLSAVNFTGVFVKSQGEISFSEENGDPITTDVTFSYVDIIYPGSLLV